jgi:hypothetical protein
MRTTITVNLIPPSFLQESSRYIHNILVLIQKKSSLTAEMSHKKDSEEFKKQTNSHKKSYSHPKAFHHNTFCTLLCTCFGYIGLQIYKFQSPPKLTITSPKDGDTVEQANIIVEGSTQVGATMEINSTYVELDSNGNFSKEIT